MTFRSLFTSTALALTVISATLSAYQYSNSCCNEAPCTGRFGIQTALASGGNLGIGLTYYTENFEFGITASGHINNARHSTKTAIPVIFAGLRQQLCNGTYFAYGINALGTFGHIEGKKIKSDYAVAPYISLEQVLTPDLILVLWVDPYNYHHQKLGCRSTTTQSFFSTGGIGLSYLY